MEYLCNKEHMGKASVYPMHLESTFPPWAAPEWQEKKSLVFMQSISQVLAPCAWTFWEGWLTGDKGASLYILSESIICHKKKKKPVIFMTQKFIWKNICPYINSSSMIKSDLSLRPLGHSSPKELCPFLWLSPVTDDLANYSHQDFWNAHD